MSHSVAGRRLSQWRQRPEFECPMVTWRRSHRLRLCHSFENGMRSREGIEKAFANAVAEAETCSHEGCMYGYHIQTQQEHTSEASSTGHYMAKGYSIVRVDVKNEEV